MLVAALARRGVGLVIASALLVLGVFQGYVLDGLAHPLASHLLHPVVAVLMAAAFVRVLTADRRSFLEHPALRLAGIISYSVYLFHWPVLAIGLDAAGIEPGRAAPATFAVAMVLGLSLVAFLIGAVSYVLVERRFMSVARPAPAVIDLRDPAPSPAPAPAEGREAVAAST